MRRSCLVLFGALALLARRGAAQTPPTTTLTFPVAADTYIDASAASANFGTAKTLVADASPVRITYLRFAVSGLGGRPVRAARLKLGVKAGGAPGGTVHRITNLSWSETTVNAKTRPAVDGPGLGTLGSVATGATVAFDLGTAISGDGVVSLAIDTTSSAAITYNSAQATSGQKPVLEVTIALTSPTVTIVQPPSGSTFFVGDPVTLQGRARDGAGTDLSSAIAWSSSLAGPLGRGALVTTPSLAEGTHTITAAVTDANGLTGSSQTALTVTPRLPVNTAPLVTITAPTAGQTLVPGPPVGFTGTANDLEDGNLSASLAWSSDRDGALGTGGTLNPALSPGTHHITASAIDRGGLTGTAAVVVDAGVVMEFTPTADASVDSALPGSNFGTSPLLRVDANAVRIIYLRFDVSGVGAAPVLHSALRLQVDAGAGADSDSGGVLHTVADTSWQESALTYDARPPANGPTLSTLGPVTLGQVAHFDAGAAVTGDGTYAFAITSNSIDEATYRSREGGPPPQLVVTIAGNPPAVAITAPADQAVSVHGRPVTFDARATDATGGDLSDRIEWTSSNDGPLGTGAALIAGTLTLGTHTITAAATDATGLRGQARITVRVRGPNQPPVVTIDAPADGASVPAGTAIGLDATAVDGWDGDVTSRIQWTDDTAGSLGVGGVRTVTLAEGRHTLTATVTDSDGATSATQVHVTVTASPPVVTITAPADRATVFTPASVTFGATAVDATDGNLTAVLRWTSDRDGPIGSGGTFSTSRLSLGQHVITASVADHGGLPGTAQRTVIVRTPNVAPTVTIMAPAAGAALLTSTRTLLAASATDPEDGDLAAAVRWTSSRDGVLGTGGMLLVPNLSVGTHVLTASATDRDGVATSATVTVTVTPATLTFGAVADAYVDASNTTGRFGTATTLWVDASPVKQAFLRFAVAGVGGFAVQQAHLRLSAAPVSAASSNTGGAVATISNTTWPELTTTYKTRPVVDGAVLATGGAVVAGQVVDFDVTSAIGADGPYNFALTTTSRDEVVYTSREAASGQPQLVVTLAQNAAPVVRITAPSAGTVVMGRPVTFTAVAADAESGDLSGAIRWTSNRDGVLGTGATTTVGMSPGIHTITASVVDAGGKTASATLTLTVDALPSVTILAPAAGVTYEPGIPVVLSGTASDPEDGSLTASIVWTSSRAGALGTGGTIAVSTLGSGTHTITAAVTDSAGLTSTRSTTLTVNATPVVGIGAPATGASFEPATPIAFTGTATDAEDGDLGPTIVWTSSRDGTLGTGTSLTVAGLSPGTHTITAAATDRTGKTGRNSIIVTVNATPVVAITAPATGTTVEAGKPVTLRATATDAEDGNLGARIAWTSSRDGALGSGAVLTVAGLSPGTHTITASARDRGGKTGRATIALTANAPPRVTIATPAAGTSIEPAEALALAATATDLEDGDLGTHVTWSSSRDGALGTGATLTVAHLTSGTHTLTAAVADSAGNTASASVTVTVNATPVVTITAPAVDPAIEPGTVLTVSGTAVDVEDGDLGPRIAWSSDRDGALGTGASLVLTGLGSGTHTIAATVTDAGGKTARATVVVTVNAAPVVTITTPAAGTAVEPGAAVTLAAAATDVEDGDLTPRIAWTSSRDGALGAGGSIMPGTLTIGTHTITASVSDANGKTGTASVTVTVSTAPTISITGPASGTIFEPGAAITLTATAADAEDGDLTPRIAWTSSRDGALGTGGSIAVGTLTSGTHDLSATVADASGQHARDTITVVVNATPRVAIVAPTADAVLEPGAVALRATATDVEDGNLAPQVVWTSSRDGTLGTGGTLVVPTLGSGAHTLTASATDAGGKTGSDTITLTVNATPQIAIDAPVSGATFEAGAPVTLAASAVDFEDGDLGTVIAWTSDLDGPLGTGAALSVTTLRSGTHTLTARVTDVGGKTAATQVTVAVNATPAVHIDAPAAGATFAPGDPVHLAATAIDHEDGDLGPFVTWVSSLDGPLGGGATLDVALLHSGAHTITASVTDGGGKSASDTRTLIVNTPPSLRIDAPAEGAVVSPGDLVAFTATATDHEDGDLGAAVTWTSDLDGALGAGATLAVTTLRSGTHHVTASVADAGGRTASTVRTVVVDAAPTLHIDTPDDGAVFPPGSLVALGGTASDLEDGDLGTAIVWTSDLDGPLGTGATLGVTLFHAGSHRVTARVVDADGRVASAERTVVVNTAPTLHIGAPDDGAVFSPDVPIFFAAAATDLEDGDLGAAVVWTSDLDGPLGTGATLAVGLVHSGIHHVTATVADQGGRTASAVRTVVVNAAPTLDIDMPADDTVFDPGALVTLAATAADREDGNLGAAVAWTSDLDGPLGVGATVGVTSLRPGLHHVTATVTDSGARITTATRTVRVNAAPTITIDGPASGSAYHPLDTVTLAATASDLEDGALGAAITWRSSRDGLLGTGAPLTTTALTPGTHTITASVADSDNRTANATTTVIIGPLVTLHGTYSTSYNHTLALDTLIDALGGTFLAGPSNLYPFNLDGAAGLLLRGGAVLGQYDRSLTWDQMHDMNNAAVALSNADSTVDGLRIDNVTDGIRPKGGGRNFTVRNVWTSYVRDDCVENDHLQAGLVDDSLFDGCHTGFSARPSPTIIDGGYDGRGKVWTIQNTLVRLEPMPDPAQGTADGLGHNTFFKWHNWNTPASSLSPKLALHNNVFMAERVGLAGGSRMGVPPGQVDSCSNNIIVWLGPGTFPGVLPAGCFTVTTDRAVWDNAVADWHARHPNAGS